MNHVACIISIEKQVPIQDLLRKSRIAQIVEARQIYFYVMNRVYNRPYIELQRLTGFDHSTVIHSCKMVKMHAETEPDYKESLDRIIYRVKTHRTNKTKPNTVSRRIEQLKSKQKRNHLILAS